MTDVKSRPNGKFSVTRRCVVIRPPVAYLGIVTLILAHGQPHASNGMAGATKQMVPRVRAAPERLATTLGSSAHAARMFGRLESQHPHDQIAVDGKHMTALCSGESRQRFSKPFVFAVRPHWWRHAKMLMAGLNSVDHSISTDSEQPMLSASHVSAC